MIFYPSTIWILPLWREEVGEGKGEGKGRKGKGQEEKRVILRNGSCDLEPSRSGIWSVDWRAGIPGKLMAQMKSKAVHRRISSFLARLFFCFCFVYLFLLIVLFNLKDLEDNLEYSFSFNWLDKAHPHCGLWSPLLRVHQFNISLIQRHSPCWHINLLRLVNPSLPLNQVSISVYCHKFLCNSLFYII